MKIEFSYTGYERIAAVEVPDANLMGVYVPRAMGEADEEAVLAMDVWEHAFLLDYKPAERPKYIEAFFSNVDWDVCEERLQTGVAARSATARDV